MTTVSIILSGVMGLTLETLTVNGYDIQFGTNVLGHFHLTMLLMPAILASPSPRVVNITSYGYQIAPKGGIQFHRLKGPKKGTRVPLLAWYEPFQWYGQVCISLMCTHCTIINTVELDHRRANL